MLGERAAHGTAMRTAARLLAGYVTLETIRRCCQAEVAALLAAGADANEHGHHASTPLADAAGNGHLEIVKILLSHGARVNIHDIWGHTPLMGAASCGRYTITKLLLDKGATVNAKAFGNHRALMGASSYGYPEIVELLLDRGADMEGATDRAGMTSLHYAVNGGNIQSVRVLIKRGADIHARDAEGMTPLRFAAKRKNKAMILLLKQSGAKQ